MGSPFSDLPGDSNGITLGDLFSEKVLTGISKLVESNPSLLNGVDHVNEEPCFVHMVLKDGDALG